MDTITIVLANLVSLAPWIWNSPSTAPAPAPGGPTAVMLARPASDTPNFPDTIAGKRAKAFIEAFNSNDPAKIRAFEEAHRAKSALKTRTTDERVAQAKQLYADWGRLDIVDVAAKGEKDITVVATATASGEGLEMEFVLEDEPPHGLVAIRIALSMGVMPGLGADAPPISVELVRDTVKAAADELEHNYVYPETGTKLAKALRSSLEAGEYDDIDNAAVLAGRLTRQLQDICKDRHLAIRAGAGGGDHGDENRWWARGPWSNFGFEKVERLPGNVGYIKFNQFNPTDDAKKVAAAAMNFVANTDALIFDLRENGGGSPEMIAFLSGYLFNQSVHLNSFYYRPTDSTEETWSDVDVPGTTFGQKKPVYVLTSHYTFSGAEEFTYNLKNLKRATIVGETTGGGAHPVQRKELNDRFVIMVPYGRAINPITKTNWEGVGVAPHVDVPAPEALTAAHKAALETLLAAADREDQKRRIKSALGMLEAEGETQKKP